MDKHNDEFEFERWADLARDDPQGFESARRKVLESLIESAPPERKVYPSTPRAPPNRRISANASGGVRRDPIPA